ncbi:uncharacterized protein Z519_07618 [Cladophialophora bantiana CBS 173.52]|uniref:N-acetyltransferase domain-containing protein n=1 Tax=Cladophialophora bantiana (strain ATCC 10958 / CBS 173.52 / CDC B-1940 / NIH 8579) TaxID=1442370 RepID=A0A0D2HLJ5_CLAB1|nr:uncharacterized protein Z519_07618 [Cladophialophora bantiana CBS 173.52]KIW91650.1 hypothetical protein Z519_07618 [Cladophialophora bantiana CBS 173.52]
MQLTDPLSLSLHDADGIVSDLASIRQSYLTTTPLGQLRYGAVPAAEARKWLESCVRLELNSELATYPRITGFDTDGRGQNVSRMEHLVVRDLDLEPLVVDQTLQSDEEARPSPGRVVAFAEFQYHPHPHSSNEPGADDARPAQSSEQEDPASAKTKTKTEPPIDLPPSAHRALHEHWDKAVEAALSAQFGGMHCFEVRGIATLSPSHLRRGIASKLLCWIFPWADRLGVPVVLAATPPGYPFYLRHGFVEVDDGGPRTFVQCNMAEWGGEGVHRHVLMIRWPTTLSDQSAS